MNKYVEKVKEVVQKAGLARILVVIVSGVLLLFLSCGTIFSGDDAPVESHTPETDDATAGSEMKHYREQMEEQVREILEQAEGVGAAQVMITLKASKERVTLKDNSTSTDKSEEKSVLVEDGNRNTQPYVIQETEPEVEGILVVCTGGDSPAVQREIIAGISALFPVESHKIKVMKRKAK